MKIYIKGHNFVYELEKLTCLFFPFEKIEFVSNKNEMNLSSFFALTEVENKKDTTELSVSVKLNDKSESADLSFKSGSSGDVDFEKETEHKLAALLFECYSKITGYRPEWGILTGIRPAKLYRKFLNMLGENGTDDFFKTEFLVSENKLELLKETSLREEKIISRSAADSVSIYISIPFCPSRCSYCSFVSHSIEKASDLIPTYLKYLCDEIELTSNIVKKLNLKVLTVYVGGGTPTTLSASQLEILLSKINLCFGNNLLELTVEAGRPDTITKDKLEVLYRAGVGRISINPQTMNDNVLKEIGRKHTTLQTVEAFNLAKTVGFKNINMDLIAGLPTDTVESFENTVKEVLKLNPESITVHSLSVKKSSKIGVEGKPSYLKDAESAAKMVDYANKELSKKGIVPYYMYRQSKTVGNLENVGYSKPGYEGLYNVYIMDETHTILACGASAVTKLKDCNSGEIERIFNYKYPYEYISHFDEIIRRKQRVEEFYIEHTF